MATCKGCIHKDVCYLIEHYGKDLCSDDTCDKFLVTPVVHGHWIAEYDCGYITPHYSDCGKNVRQNDVLAMNMKIYGRNITEFKCKKCLMKDLNMSKDEWNEKVEDFKAQGCTLF